MFEHFKLNYPIETPEALSFWASKHLCNRLKAIVAFSTSEANAIDNLRRRGYQPHLRDRAVKAYKPYINNPSMKDIPFSEMGNKWWECL